MVGIFKLTGYILSIAIVVQSFLARFGFINLSKVIKFTSNSARLRFIIVCVFSIFFLNYGLLYIIAPLQLEIPIASEFFLGIYSDFNQFWFSDIGYLVIQTSGINAIMPPIEFGLIWLWRNILRGFDQKKCWPKFPPEFTSKKTLCSYKDLYSGEDFDIHYQYSWMLVITWVTFLFAPGLPILFPIALVGMIILYVTNRLSLAYYNKRPPVYDYKMTQTTLKMLGFAPILYVCVGAWLYSN